jgi:hypothetical protein
MSEHFNRKTTLAHSGTGKQTPPTEADGAQGDNEANGTVVSDDGIRLYAYQKWQSAGKPTGDGSRFWLEAEQELLNGMIEDADRRVGSHGRREHEELGANKGVKESDASVDSHYRDNNRMFQNHGERGHRHGSR